MSSEIQCKISDFARFCIVHYVYTEYLQPDFLCYLSCCCFFYFITEIVVKYKENNAKNIVETVEKVDVVKVVGK